jgi:hypothetical protein
VFCADRVGDGVGEVSLNCRPRLDGQTTTQTMATTSQLQNPREPSFSVLTMRAGQDGPLPFLAKCQGSLS